MNKLFLVITVAMMACCISVNAQENKKQKAPSLTIGVSPFGSSKAKIIFTEDLENHYKYSPLTINVGLEKMFKGISHLLELSYTNCSFDEYSSKKERDTSKEIYRFPNESDLNDISLCYYAGYTFNKNKRLQIPLYIGIGGEYLTGDLFKKILFDFAVKARVKYYISNKVGLFIGGTWKYGIGSKRFTAPKAFTIESATGQQEVGSIDHQVGYIDAGITISLK